MKSTQRNGHMLYLVENLEDFDRVERYVHKSSLCGLDTETNSLSYITGSIAGYCISAGNPQRGFYIPVRHVIGNNIPLDRVVALVNYIFLNKKVILFNRNFDNSMMEKDGVVIPFDADMHDAQTICWIATNEPFPSLKKFCREYLKWDMIDFGDAAGEDENGNSNYDFSKTDPQTSFPYAAHDPVATVELFKYMWNNFPYARKIYPLDNRATEAARRMGQYEIHIDYNKLRKMSEEADLELRSLRNQIYAMVGYEFNLNSNREKAEALGRFCTLTVKTSKGQFSVKDEVLSEIDHPLAQLLVRYSKQAKFVSSFIKPIMAMEGKPIHANFKMCDVPCLTKDSFVEVVGKGHISVSEVQEGDLIWTSKGWNKVLANEMHLHDSPLLEIQAENGIKFKCTPWHPVLVQKRFTKKLVWREASSLSVGDRIKRVKSGFNFGDCRYISYNYGGESLLVTAPALRSIAFFLYKRRQFDNYKFNVSFDENDAEGAHLYLNSLFTYFGLQLHQVRRVTMSDVHRIVFEIRSPEFIKLLNSFSNFTEWLCRQPNELIRYAAYGIVDATRVILGNTVYLSGSMLKGDEYHIFAALNLDYSKEGVNDITPDNYLLKFDNKSQSNKDWAEQDELIDKYFKGGNNNSVCKVLSIKRVDPEPVYHIEVEDVHEYAADSLVHHNTGRMACGSSKGNDYYVRANIQALPKKKMEKFIHEGSDLGYYLSDEEEGALGKQEVKAGFRDIFCTPDDSWCFVSADYCISPKTRVKRVFKGLFGPQEEFCCAGELRDGDLIETPQGYKKISNFHRTDKRQQVEVKMKDGRVIHCSSDHRFAVRDLLGRVLWKKVIDIDSSDVIIENSEHLSELEQRSLGMKV